MTLKAVKETIYQESFQTVLEETKNETLKKIRQQAYEYFAENGFPTQKNEEWKYTNITPAINADFRFCPGPEWEYEVDYDRLGQFGYDRNGFAALNLALCNILYVRIPKDTVRPTPIKFDFVLHGNVAIAPHVILIAEAGSKATIIESYESDEKSFTNSGMQIFLEDNASITHYRVQKESPEALHVGTTEVSLGRGSLYDSTNINLGAKLSRHDIHVRFTATGGEAYVDGLYMLEGNQHHDTHSSIDHALPNCVSHQTYKGVLNDKSRGVFNGKVFVGKNASGTDAQQSNKNLLLSNDARVDTKPQLEIFNDDVKCSHGATVGQLEEEELFYLLSRGLNESLAKNLLTYGFAEEIINKIAIEEIKTDLDEAVLNRLDVQLEA